METVAGSLDRGFGQAFAWRDDPAVDLPQPYAGSLEHLLQELERIDLLVQLQVARARRLNRVDEAFQGLHISEEEVDALLARPVGAPHWAAAVAPPGERDWRDALERMSQHARRRRELTRAAGIPLRLERLAHLFGLSALDVDLLLVCLAPELDVRYERLYAYLQDDVTRKRPSVDLVLNLLGDSFAAKVGARQRLATGAPLLRHRLLERLEDPAQPHPTLLSSYLKIAPRVVEFLLDGDAVDSDLQGVARLVSPRTRLEELVLADGLTARLERVAAALGAWVGQGGRGPLVYLEGAYGSGRRSVAEALCHGVGVLLEVDLARLAAEPAVFESRLAAAVREAQLQGAALFWDGFDDLLAEGREPLLAALLRTWEDPSQPAFVSATRPWQPAGALRDLIFFHLVLPEPGYAQRRQLWRRFLDRPQERELGPAIEAVANGFRLSGGQIRDAVATARNRARARGGSGVDAGDLTAACRLGSNRQLAALARVITPRYDWDDIVLPADRLAQLHEICTRFAFRARVHDDWGFGRKLVMGKGLNVLFSGPSGTGKTMAAEIIAGRLGLELYKIDLASTVSKYIGETEKNLSRLFAEARSANAILFFDEADALFGKRTEVRDAHDRYANIEVGYLLQRMEEYDGVVILATNFRRNMDDAFVRRMHFTVDFPLPGEAERRRMWAKIWPEATPREPGLDLDLLAGRLEVTGGNIRNIALAAAFHAAEEDARVGMRHLFHAARREYQKMGKIAGDKEIGGCDAPSPAAGGEPGNVSSDRP